MAPRREAVRLILASGSKVRRQMLAAAGLSFEVHPADVDEQRIEAEMTVENACVDPADIASVLAAAKAEAVSKQHPDAIVIGADQTLSVGTWRLSKAASREEARATLMRLHGREHELHSAVAIAVGGAAAWGYVETARLHMRALSDDFLASYLDRAGEALTASVGAYEIEGLGAQLFERIEGDYFTILGMPLLALLGELRRREVLPA